MEQFTGNVISVREKASRFGNGTYLGIMAKGDSGKVWFAGGTDLLNVLCDDAEIKVEFENADFSDDGRIRFLKRARVTAVDGEPIEQPKPKAQAPRAQGPSQGGLKGIVGFFAGSPLTYPKLIATVGGELVTDEVTGEQKRVGGTTYRVYRHGEASKYCGQINIVEDGNTSNWFGRIDFHGNFRGRQLPEDLRTFLIELAENPREVAAKHGKEVGSCCFCGKRIEQQASLEAGYGPVCAENYGLPHGAR